MISHHQTWLIILFDDVFVDVEQTALSLFLLEYENLGHSFLVIQQELILGYGECDEDR